MGSLSTTTRLTEAGVEALWFAPDGWVPNNAHLPVLHYLRALPSADASAEAFEQLLRTNGWAPQWRNGIYAFHHYHSTAHEVLAIAAGRAIVRLGGANGCDVEVVAGMCVVLPAGTGHCLIEQSPDLLVIGAYPPGQDWDLRRHALSDADQSAMARLPIPDHDPVCPVTAPLRRLWGQAQATHR